MLWLVLLGSWIFWIPAGFGNIPATTTVQRLLLWSGGLIPAAVVLAFVHSEGARAREVYRHRLFGLRRIRPTSWAVIFLLAFGLTALAGLIDCLVGGRGVFLEAGKGILQQPFSVVPFLFGTLLFGPLPEELAWRGYVQPGLQRHHAILPTSVVIGVLWTVWHLPLFQIDGTYQHSLGIGTQGFWLFMSDKVPQSVIMGWLYNRTRGSTLSAVLFHTSVNLVGELFGLSTRAELIYVGLWWVVAAGLALLLGFRRTPQCLGASPQ